MTRVSPILVFASFAALAAVTAGCGEKNMTPPKGPEAEVAVHPAPPPAARKEGINLSQEIRDACGIAAVTEAPKFDYDSSAMSASDRDQLNQLARCLTTGALKGRAVQLVGRADPRDHGAQVLDVARRRTVEAVRDVARRARRDGQRRRIVEEGPPRRHRAQVELARHAEEEG
jgi:hypothetical protein